MSFGFLHLSGAIPAFHDRFPQITVEAVMNDRFVDLIDEGYDVALRIGDMRDSSLVARRLAPCWSVLCASTAYLDRRGRPARPADLAAHDCQIGSTQGRERGCQHVWLSVVGASVKKKKA